MKGLVRLRWPSSLRCPSPISLPAVTSTMPSTLPSVRMLERYLYATIHHLNRYCRCDGTGGGCAVLLWLLTRERRQLIGKRGGCGFFAIGGFAPQWMCLLLLLLRGVGHATRSRGGGGGRGWSITGGRSTLKRFLLVGLFLKEKTNVALK